MTHSTAKFTFDTEFRSDKDFVSTAALARQKKAYTHDEIDALCAEARMAGLEAGQVRAQEAIAAAIAGLTSTIRAVLQQTQRDIETLRAEAADVALAAARKLARTAIAAAPQQEVELALREAMHLAIGEPRLVVRAAPAVLAALEDAVETMAAAEGFDGRVVLSGDPHANGADCRIEWRGAGIERTQECIESALADLIARRFSQISSKG
jgi:flagellar assembly protein FliH